MYLFAENSLLFLTLFFFIIILNFVFMKLILEIQLSGGRSWDHINRFYLPLFCACPKPGPGFLMAYVVVFIFAYLR
jgi:hypothetical protein